MRRRTFLQAIGGVFCTTPVKNDAKIDAGLQYVKGWEPKNYRSRLVWLDGVECGNKIRATIANPEASVEVTGAVEFYIFGSQSLPIYEDDQWKTEWKTGKIKWELE